MAAVRALSVLQHSHGETVTVTLERVQRTLPRGRVSLGWLHRELDAEATTLLIFVLALIGALPGASLPAGLAICALASRIMLSRESGLPSAIATRQIAAGSARYALRRAIAMTRICERLLPRRGEGAVAGLRPVAGALLFVMGAIMLVPIPLSNVPPAFAAAAVALALAAGSLPLLVVSSVSAIGALALVMVAVSTAIAHF